MEGYNSLVSLHHVRGQSERHATTNSHVRLHMYVYACICMYMHVYVCICMYTYVYVCIRMYTYVYVYVMYVYV